MTWMGYPVRQCKKCKELYAGYWCPFCDKDKKLPEVKDVELLKKIRDNLS